MMAKRSYKDLSRKLRSSQRIKSKQGYAIGLPPLGYKHDPDEPKRWIIDEEGAEIVRKIYDMRLQGVSLNDIALKLKRTKILTPTAYAKEKGLRNFTKTTRGDTFWCTATVTGVLQN